MLQISTLFANKNLEYVIKSLHLCGVVLAYIYIYYLIVVCLFSAQSTKGRLSVLFFFLQSYALYICETSMEIKVYFCDRNR